MKKSLVARGFIGAVASLLGVAAVGCGADVGDGAAGDSAEIGSTSEALSSTTSGLSGLNSDVDPDVGDSVTNTPSRVFAASCAVQITVSNQTHDVLVFAGGFTAAGSPLNDVLLYDVQDNKWVNPKLLNGGTHSSEHLTNARGGLAGIKTGTNTCAFTGGASAPFGTALTDVDVVTVNNDLTISVSAKTAMNNARSMHRMATCGGNKLVLVGGFDNAQSLGAKFIAPIEISNSFTPTSWDNTTSLSRGRYAFGLANDTVDGQYFVAGGHSNTLAQETSVEMIKLSSCSPANATIATAQLGTGVEGNVAFFDQVVSGKSRFIVAGGRTSTAASSAVRKIDVDWSTPSVFASAADTALTTAAAYPTLIESSKLLMGGTDGAQTSSTDPLSGASLDTIAVTNALASYSSGSWTTAAAATQRAYGVAEKIGSDVYLVGGVSFASGTATDILSLEKVTP